MKKVRWGVLGCAKIAREKVIPAMQRGELCAVTAIASREAEVARRTAKTLGIDKAYGSYIDLLQDPDVDAVYIPLPNHLHVPWTIKALKAGKHVLCEKPIGLEAVEARALHRAVRSFPHLKVMEAFMYRHHPQWVRTKQLVDSGAIGGLRSIQSAFSYFNVDPGNVRNQAEIGGGALMDIGCYCISLARFLFGREPLRVAGVMERDPAFETDYLTSGVMDFEGATSTFVCATQMAPHQHVDVFGTTGKIAIEIPFNAPPDRPTRILLSTGNSAAEELTFEPADQYTIQGDLFAKAVLDGTDVPTPLTDAVANMVVMDAIVRSAERGSWESVEQPH